MTTGFCNAEMWDGSRCRRPAGCTMNHTARPEASTALADSAQQAAALDALAGEPRPMRELSKGSWQVDSDQEPPQEEASGTPGVQVVRFGITPDPHRSARLAAAVDTWDRPADVQDRLDVGAANNDKVTLLLRRENRFGGGSVTVDEVKLAHGSAGQLAYLPKGKRSNGYVLRADNVLEVRDGWGQSRQMADAWHAHAYEVPPVAELTQADLDALPGYGPNGAPSKIGLTVLGTHPGFGDGRAAGCVWFLTDYDAEDDIANGYMWAPPESGLTSEHGSIHGEQLRRWGGRTNTPDGFEFADCMDLRDASRADVWPLLHANQT